MAVTQDSLRDRTRAHLHGAEPTARPAMDVLQGSMSDVTVAVEVDDGASWSPGDIVDFSDTGEQAVVTTVIGNDISLARGPDAVAHLSGLIVYRNPRFSTKAIDYAINDVLLDLYPDVYKITTKELTYADNQYWYPIDNPQLREVVTVYHNEPFYNAPRAIPYAWQYRGVDQTEFTEGQGVLLHATHRLKDGDKFWVVYREEIDEVDDLLDRQEALVAHGATVQLLLGATVTRTQDPGRHTDRGVQPGQEARDSLHYLREYVTKRRREEIRLRMEEDRFPKSTAFGKVQRYRP